MKLREILNGINYQIIGNEKVPFSEKEIVLDTLKTIK